jgi:hypothetical protein
MKKSYLQSLIFVTAAAITIDVCGCAGTFTNPSAASPAVRLQGTVHGGQQPVAGATIQLYAASTAGYGGASTALITAASTPVGHYPVLSDANGNFTITGDYTCPADAQVYLTASQGNPGGGNNPALALMAALGPCSSLTSSTFINVNELTTVSSVWALAPFMSGAAAVGTSSTNVSGMTRAFSAVNKLVNTSTGVMPGPALPAGAVLPLAELNTIADILASCVNTTGSTGSGTTCGALFNASTVGSSAPADTIAAALNIARNPSQNVVALCNLALASSPYQPTLPCATPPAAWTIAIQYTGGGLNAPKAIAADANGNLWLANSGNNSVTELDNSGAAQSGVSGFTGGSLSSPSAIALDLSGNAWVINSGNDSVTRIAALRGAALSFTGGGLNVPQSIAIDASGNIWVANYGNSSLSELSASGTPLSPAGTGFTGSGIHQPTSIAINPY